MPLANKSIDDTLGDEVTGTIPTYTPGNVWNGANCRGCSIRPDTGKAYRGTWHETTYRYDGSTNDVSVEFSFTGSDAFY